MKKPSFRKLFRSVFFTVLPAVAILIFGCLLLIGAHALLPQHTGQYKEYSIDPATLDGDELTLYPWNELTEMTPYEGIFGAQDMADALNGWQIPFYDLQMDHAEYLTNRTNTILGIRGIEFTSYMPLRISEFEQQAAALHTLSVAFKEDAYGIWICYLHAERQEKKAEGAALQSGYEQLCVQAGQPFDTDYSPFVSFLRWVEMQSVYDATKTIYTLLESGPYSSFLYQGEAYFCYASNYLSLTLIVDVTTGTLAGFSLESL